MTRQQINALRWVLLETIDAAGERYHHLPEHEAKQSYADLKSLADLLTEHDTKQGTFVTNELAFVRHANAWRTKQG